MIGSVRASQADESDKNRKNRRVFHILDSTRIASEYFCDVKHYKKEKAQHEK